MEFHRKSLLLFQLVIVRLVAEGDALLPHLRQPLAVDLDTVPGWGRDRDVTLPDYFVSCRGDRATLYEDVPGDSGGWIRVVYCVSSID